MITQKMKRNTEHAKVEWERHTRRITRNMRYVDAVTAKRDEDQAWANYRACLKTEKDNVK